MLLTFFFFWKIPFSFIANPFCSNELVPFFNRFVFSYGFYIYNMHGFYHWHIYVTKINVRVDGWLAGWMDGWMAGWMAGWMDGRMDGLTNGWMDGWMDGQNVKHTPLRVWHLALCVFVSRVWRGTIYSCFLTIVIWNCLKISVAQVLIFGWPISSLYCRPRVYLFPITAHLHLSWRVISFRGIPCTVCSAMFNTWFIDFLVDE